MNDFLASGTLAEPGADPLRKKLCELVDVHKGSPPLEGPAFVELCTSLYEQGLGFGMKREAIRQVLVEEIAAFADEGIWKTARSVDTIAAYARYLASTTSEKHRKEAELRISELKPLEEAAQEADERLWAETRSADTIAAYSGYLKSTERMTHVDEAKRRSAELIDLALRTAEEALWSETIAKNTPDAYEHYLRTTRLNTHSTESRRKIHELTDKAAWREAATIDTPPAIRNYLARSGDKAFKDSALERLAQLVDAEAAAAFAQAKDVGSADALRAFLKQHFNSKYADEAAARMATTIDTPEAVREYLARPEPKKFEAQARSRLLEIVERDAAPAFRIAGSVNTVAGWDAFLSRFGDSSYADAAAAKKAFAADTSQALQDYIGRPGSKRFVEKAQARLAELLESEETEARQAEERRIELHFQKAESVGTVVAWKEFLGQCGNSPLAATARTRLNDAAKKAKLLRFAFLLTVAVPIILIPIWMGFSCTSKTEPDARGLTVELGSGVQMRMIRIKAGTFTMGSPAGEVGRNDNETQHEVRLTRDYYLGETEVTVGQFRRFVDETGYKTEAETSGGAKFWDEKTAGVTWKTPGFAQDDRHPVVVVSWNDAKYFCAWLSRKEGKTFRLPTEAEWEYAARAGSRTQYPSGEAESSVEGHANVADQAVKKMVCTDAEIFDFDDGYVFTAPVKSFRANSWSLHDMIGNVGEWCEDWYADYPKQAVTDPSGPTSGRDRVFRAGGWSGGPRGCRSAVRFTLEPGDRYLIVGFRVCLVLP